MCPSDSNIIPSLVKANFGSFTTFARWVLRICYLINACRAWKVQCLVHHLVLSECLNVSVRQNWCVCVHTFVCVLEDAQMVMNSNFWYSCAHAQHWLSKYGDSFSWKEWLKSLSAIYCASPSQAGFSQNCLPLNLLNPYGLCWLEILWCISRNVMVFLQLIFY